jgi:hypothetical protein
MKAILPRLLRIGLRSLSCGLCALVLGCQSTGDWSLTYKLWNNESFHDFKMPASDPQVRLFADERRSDVLVVYDEVRENDGSVRRRAFFANRNLERIRDGRKPRFVGLSACSGLKPIPVLRFDSSKALPGEGLAVVTTDRPYEFLLYSDARQLGAVGLPAYGSNGGFKKTLLTPLAVTGDTLIVGTVVGLYAVVAYAGSGVRVSTCH